ncbi:DsbA family protein [Siphonobacter curvatus]|uniref:Disulfide bond formation protein DsbA n=1 Tax=Siphonobacter curvatus TaxID=2094562 RepID=A0A2S7IJN9_9BACT|nr:thioredoxin domain-containing protein [Siphonobacter curvatus]PQA56880.1 disulfide bond formation protein DsbA [Siphonobacter curvatus]
MLLKPSVSSQDHAIGKADANLVIVEYGDYQCPYCGAAYPVLKELMREFGDQIKFVFRNFPLSEIHPFARPAALVAEAAALQGKFWEMHDAIYENQSSLSTDFLFELADQLGLDPTQLQSDLKQDSVEERVDADFESGMRSGVNGTPSFFVNGQKFNGGAENLLDLIRSNAS